MQTAKLLSESGTQGDIAPGNFLYRTIWSGDLVLEEDVYSLRDFKPSLYNYCRQVD